MNFDFEAGEVILVDKPYGWTSFDVVNFIKHRTKRITGNKKLKVGHAGTLDPLATGLLLVCTGKMTKQIDKLQAAVKGYKGTIYLGGTTPSYDLESKVSLDKSQVERPAAEVAAIAQTFLGEQQQVPPIFSAKKIDGKRAYEAARKGEKRIMQANSVSIYKFDIARYSWPQVEFDIVCSKGTYIRSIAFDMGEKLACGGFLAALRRTQIGDYYVKDALKMSDLKIMLDKAL